MSKTKPGASVDTVLVRYDLFDLPTAQHKAGLAGLILQIRHMQQPERNFAVDEIPDMEVSPTLATIRFTKKSVQALFDDLYDASPELKTVKKKWPEGELVETLEEDEKDPKSGKIARVKKFIYKVIQPRGHFLRQHLPHEMDPSKDWLNLWRDMIWAIPRGKPTTRIPFQQCAAEGHCRESENVWKELVQVEKCRSKNAYSIAKISGALWLGAQEQNAETIPFQGRVEQNLLLHFWPLTVMVFVPQRINNDGETELGNASYALAIPEVAHLENFCEDYLDLLHNLPREIRGYRPAKAIIDLPAQAAMEFLAQLASHLVGKKNIHDDVSTVEYLHLAKRGNNIKAMAAGRIAPDPQRLDEYLLIAGSPKHPAFYRNPLFRAGLLQALMRRRPWYEGLADTLLERPWPLLVRAHESPKNLPWFATDAAAKFQIEWENYQKLREVYQVSSKTLPDVASELPQPGLPILVHRLVRAYVLRKTEEKSKLKWDDFKDKKKKDKDGVERVDIPQAYSDARERIASSIFLEMRSRREQDFVEHFTNTFCSVKQFLPEPEFQVVANALLKEPEAVKTLTLLALSANS
jgi:CRISPR-associated protein Cmx8